MDSVSGLCVHKDISYFKNFYRAGSRIWFHWTEISRKSLVSINRLRNGHFSLRKVWLVLIL